MNDVKTKQEIVDKIQSSTNVLVTVSNDPSVDELSAALALTVMLNKLGKHTTAIFSGAVPPAITFLDPQKTFESSTDSLRDFIIALDKEKADHLRYKVEGDMVKIFITPYRTKITDEDLQFSQGDYNVELVLALGVENQSHLDGALEAHGSILHDATVVTLSVGDTSSSLGSIDWHDEKASSLSEMLVELADTLKADTPLLDEQIATALLTGIVAETDRFSNTRTSSKVMTIAAQLMAAGADQQLIAAKLQESHTIGAKPVLNGAVTMNGSNADQATPLSDGFSIDHGEESPVTPPVEEATSSSESSPEPVVQNAYAEALEPAAPSGDPVVKIADAYALDPEAPVETAPVETTPSVEPLLGGVEVPAPAPVAAEPVQAPVVAEPAPAEDISKHSYLSDAPTYNAPMNGATQPNGEAGVDIFATGQPAPQPTIAPDAAIPPTDAPAPATPDLSGTRDESSRDDALAAVHASYDGTVPAAQPFSPAPGITLPPPPPLPDFSALPTAAPVASAYALDPLPPQPTAAPAAEPAPAPSSDPAQFRIPGQ